MKNDNACEQTMALMTEALEVLRRADQAAPPSPVNAFLTGKMRRRLRRTATRLRQGQARPRYMNLHTAQQLAEVYERTIRRDEIYEQALEEFRRITHKLDRILEENGDEFRKGLATLMRDAIRQAEEQGYTGAAAYRLQQMILVAFHGHKKESRGRRQRPEPSGPLGFASDPSVEKRHQRMAAEVLTAPPAPEETVIAIPPEGRDSGRGRIMIRIGTDQYTWTGSFERGHGSVTTACLLPDEQHLFIAVEGAGYIVDVQSRTLVETLGTKVAGVMRNEPLTLFVVDHGGLCLEAFGKSGRLWKTDTISGGGFRQMSIIGNTLVGEARDLNRPGWTIFAVHLKTGDIAIV